MKKDSSFQSYMRVKSPNTSWGFFVCQHLTRINRKWLVASSWWLVQNPFSYQPPATSHHDAQRSCFLCRNFTDKVYITVSVAGLVPVFLLRNS